MNKKSKFDEERLFEEFPAEEQEEIRQLWEESKAAEVDKPEIQDEDIDQALSNVHDQIEGSANKVSNRWRWLAAAAAIFLMIGAGILFVPRTASAPHGEFVTVTLPDGSSVELNSGSELQYGWLYDITNRSVSIDGEGYFVVQESESPFTVTANGATVRVTGTEFNVRSWSDHPSLETTVAVAEGSVKFYPGKMKGAAVTLAQGESSRWAQAMETPTAPKEIAMDRVSAWREHRLVFDQEPLSVIFQELERRFDTQITLDAAQMSAETLTTYYSNPDKNIESILKDICRVKGLRFAPTANGYRVYK